MILEAQTCTLIRTTSPSRSQKNVNSSTDLRENQDQRPEQRPEQRPDQMQGQNLLKNGLKMLESNIFAFDNCCKEEKQENMRHLSNEKKVLIENSISNKTYVSDVNNLNIENKMEEVKMVDAQRSQSPSHIFKLSFSVCGYMQSVNTYLNSYMGLSKGQHSKTGNSNPKSCIVYGLFTEKLLDVYQDANRKFQGTRKIIQNVQIQDVTCAVTNYVSNLSRELPIIPKLKSTFVPREQDIAEEFLEEEKAERSEESTVKTKPTKLQKNGNLFQTFMSKETPGVTGWPLGSVHCIEDRCLRVFHQKLVKFPAPLSKLMLLQNAHILPKLPAVHLGKTLSIFFVEAADHKTPIPTPAIVVVCADGLALIQGQTQAYMRVMWSEVMAAEVGLGGQCVRMIGKESKGQLLTVLTHSARLTQEFCKEIVNAQDKETHRKCSNLKPEDPKLVCHNEKVLKTEVEDCSRNVQKSLTKEKSDFLETCQCCEKILENKTKVSVENVQEKSSKAKGGFLEICQCCDSTFTDESNRENCNHSSKNIPKFEKKGLEFQTFLHPLLSTDLMSLSLDWTSQIPDLVLPNGLRLITRFKRVLANLLYLVHGNMESTERPYLAHVQPIVFTSVQLKSNTKQEIVQFLLTDSHVCLVKEDPVIVKSWPVSVGLLGLGRSCFRSLIVQRRAEIRCVFARSIDNCVELEMTFNVRKHQGRIAEERRRSVDVKVLNEHSLTWNCRFGDSSDAAMVLRHLWN